ncbi:MULTISPECIES: M24 family metallopeptidase [Rhodanobacter]|uniref:M24 family metallopeptidase n=1 Tax=Rhodanobacter TaxID=75309 RepID=UPI00040D4CE6|nr:MULTISPECIES: M24 family metallopeptidase [Rhodanobacter]TAN14787.1 MAG: aminopeptidase P family protein [Rhodanobacter sp.]UJJ55693.1 aminopeptidase P family protein [Rhodanobacter thiooxydans]
MTSLLREAVGQRYDPTLMQRAREKSWAALHGIRARMHPGISENEAKVEAADVFRELGVERLWHPAIIRIGANTLKTYRHRSEPGVRLGENDSYFIDLGLVFDGHEGDVGDTFVVGHAPQRRACAEAARALFGEVADAWRIQGLSGQVLYALAGERAAAMGWRFNHAIKGHRISDFPHAIHKGGDLGELEASPSSGLWMLEIQLAHPTEPFGAFHEDLLVA